MLGPSTVTAEEIRAHTHKAFVRVGEEFVVSILVDITESPVNALEGRITFPDKVLSVAAIHDGNSSINLWIKKPHLDENQIVFAGITPGGFVGIGKHLFSIVFVAEEAGMASIDVQSSQIRAHNGQATIIQHTARSATLEIAHGDSSERKEVFVDTEPPEDFVPIIANDPNVFGGDWFIVFQTQDKGLGIDRYMIKEGKWSRYRVAESPYHLQNQSRDVDIYITALDVAGNERYVVVLGETKSSNWMVVSVIVLGVGALLSWCVRRRLF